MQSYNSVKVCIIGSCNVGKTSIILKYLNNKKTVDTTLGAIFWQIEHTPKCGSSFYINLWDTAGQERYNSLIPMYSRNSEIMLLTFDITDRNSFIDLKKWVKIANNNNPDSAIILIGNKIDKSFFRKTESNEVKDFINKNFESNILYFETSAETGENINELFDKIFKIALTKIKIKKITEDAKKIKVDLENNKLKFTCCAII